MKLFSLSLGVCVLAAAGMEPAPLRRESQSDNRIAVALQAVQFLPAGQVPNADLAIIAARSRTPAIDLIDLKTVKHA